MAVVATEITRIQNAKASLKTAINAKGGTLTTETLDQYASAVNGIATQKEEETKTVTPDFSSGNVVVTPTTNKVMTQVTINKDANFIAENFKKDVTAFGITGTLESGGVSYITTTKYRKPYTYYGTGYEMTYTLSTTVTGTFVNKVTGAVVNSFYVIHTRSSVSRVMVDGITLNDGEFAYFSGPTDVLFIALYYNGTFYICCSNSSFSAFTSSNSTSNEYFGSYNKKIMVVGSTSYSDLATYSTNTSDAFYNLRAFPTQNPETTDLLCSCESFTIPSGTYLYYYYAFRIGVNRVFNQTSISNASGLIIH